MQRGARFAIDGVDVACLTILKDNEAGVSISHESTGISVAYRDISRIRELVCRAGRLCTLIEVGDRTLLVDAVAHDVKGPLAVSADFVRVALTGTTLFLASEAEVRPFDHVRGVGEPIAMDAADIATSATHLAAIDSRGITWFDHAGQFVHRAPVENGTAIAFDGIAKSWLVAAGGQLLELVDPTAPARVIVRELGACTRIRRGHGAIYAAVSDQLVEIVGGVATAIGEATHDFDASNLALQVANANGYPSEYWSRSNPCKCRVREIEVVRSWQDEQEDYTVEKHVEYRCPACGHGWSSSWFDSGGYP